MASPSPIGRTSPEASPTSPTTCPVPTIASRSVFSGLRCPIELSRETLIDFLAAFGYHALSADAWRIEIELPRLTIRVEGHAVLELHRMYFVDVTIQANGALGSVSWRAPRRLEDLRSALHIPVKDALGKEYDIAFRNAHFAMRGGLPGTTARLDGWFSAFARLINVGKFPPWLVAQCLQSLAFGRREVLQVTPGPIGESSVVVGQPISLSTLQQQQQQQQEPPPEQGRSPSMRSSRSLLSLRGRSSSSGLKEQEGEEDKDVSQSLSQGPTPSQSPSQSMASPEPAPATSLIGDLFNQQHGVERGRSVDSSDDVGQDRASQQEAAVGAAAASSEDEEQHSVVVQKVDEPISSSGEDEEEEKEEEQEEKQKGGVVEGGDGGGAKTEPFTFQPEARSATGATWEAEVPQFQTQTQAQEDSSFPTTAAIAAAAAAAGAGLLGGAAGVAAAAVVVEGDSAAEASAAAAAAAAEAGAAAEGSGVQGEGREEEQETVPLPRMQADDLLSFDDSDDDVVAKATPQARDIDGDVGVVGVESTPAPADELVTEAPLPPLPPPKVEAAKEAEAGAEAEAEEEATKEQKENQEKIEQTVAPTESPADDLMSFDEELLPETSDAKGLVDSAISPVDDSAPAPALESETAAWSANSSEKLEGDQEGIEAMKGVGMAKSPLDDSLALGDGTSRQEVSLVSPENANIDIDGGTLTAPDREDFSKMAEQAAAAEHEVEVQSDEGREVTKETEGQLEQANLIANVHALPVAAATEELSSPQAEAEVQNEELTATATATEPPAEASLEADDGAQEAAKEDKTEAKDEENEEDKADEGSQTSALDEAYLQGAQTAKTQQQEEQQQQQQQQHEDEEKEKEKEELQQAHEEEQQQQHEEEQQQQQHHHEEELKEEEKKEVEEEEGAEDDKKGEDKLSDAAAASEEQQSNLPVAVPSSVPPTDGEDHHLPFPTATADQSSDGSDVGEGRSELEEDVNQLEEGEAAKGLSTGEEAEPAQEATTSAAQAEEIAQEAALAVEETDSSILAGAAEPLAFAEQTQTNDGMELEVEEEEDTGAPAALQHPHEKEEDKEEKEEEKEEQEEKEDNEEKKEPDEEEKTATAQFAEHTEISDLPLDDLSFDDGSLGKTKTTPEAAEGDASEDSKAPMVKEMSADAVDTANVLSPAPVQAFPEGGSKAEVQDPTEASQPAVGDLMTFVAGGAQDDAKVASNDRADVDQGAVDEGEPLVVAMPTFSGEDGGDGAFPVDTAGIMPAAALVKAEGAEFRMKDDNATAEVLAVEDPVAAEPTHPVAVPQAPEADLLGHDGVISNVERLNEKDAHDADEQKQGQLVDAQDEAAPAPSGPVFGSDDEADRYSEGEAGIVDLADGRESSSGVSDIGAQGPAPVEAGAAATAVEDEEQTTKADVFPSMGPGEGEQQDIIDVAQPNEGGTIDAQPSVNTGDLQVVSLSASKSATVGQVPRSEGEEQEEAATSAVAAAAETGAETSVTEPATEDNQALPTSEEQAVDTIAGSDAVKEHASDEDSSNREEEGGPPLAPPSAADASTSDLGDDNEKAVLPIDGLEGTTEPAAFLPPPKQATVSTKQDEEAVSAPPPAPISNVETEDVLNFDHAQDSDNSSKNRETEAPSEAAVALPSNEEEIKDKEAIEGEQLTEAPQVPGASDLMSFVDDSIAQTGEVATDSVVEEVMEVEPAADSDKEEELTAIPNPAAAAARDSSKGKIDQTTAVPTAEPAADVVAGFPPSNAEQQIEEDQTEKIEQTTAPQASDEDPTTAPAFKSTPTVSEGHQTVAPAHDDLLGADTDDGGQNNSKNVGGPDAQESSKPASPAPETKKENSESEEEEMHQEAEHLSKAKENDLLSFGDDEQVDRTSNLPTSAADDGVQEDDGTSSTEKVVDAEMKVADQQEEELAAAAVPPALASTEVPNHLFNEKEPPDSTVEKLEKTPIGDMAVPATVNGPLMVAAEADLLGFDEDQPQSAEPGQAGTNRP